MGGCGTAPSVQFRKGGTKYYKRGNDLSLIKRERNKDTAGASGKLSWHLCRVCFTPAFMPCGFLQ